MKWEDFDIVPVPDAFLYEHVRFEEFVDVFPLDVAQDHNTSHEWPVLSLGILDTRFREDGACKRDVALFVQTPKVYMMLWTNLISTLELEKSRCLGQRQLIYDNQSSFCLSLILVFSFSSYRGIHTTPFRSGIITSHSFALEPSTALEELVEAKEDIGLVDMAEFALLRATARQEGRCEWEMILDMICCFGQSTSSAM